MMEIIYFILLLLAGTTFGLWNNLNCPAPRSPENGLSFIFKNGELVHFRCHPGYMMMGKAVAYCVDNHWTAPAPECILIRKGSRRTVLNPSTVAIRDDSNYYRHELNDPEANNNNISTSTMSSRGNINKSLFNWDNKSRRKSVYGDGPRRVPLINGIWPGQDIQLMALGPQTTPGPVDLIREEINIAELRHKQYEEVKKQRHLNPNLDLVPAKRRKNGKKGRKNKNNLISNDVNDYSSGRETLISLGTTHDGRALSISQVRPSNDSNLTENDLHKYRHRDPARKRKGKGKKWKNRLNNQQPNNIVARSSRVDTSGIGIAESNLRSKFKNSKKGRRYNENDVQEFRRLPVSHVSMEEAIAVSKSRSQLANYDTSCVESFYGRDVPKIAPQITNAFVYRYETKKNKDFPFNGYMQVKYKCMNGYVFADNRVQVLNCKEAAWIGEVPKCTLKTD